MGFALPGRAGRVFPDLTAEAEAQHVSLLSGVVTILRIRSPKTERFIDSPRPK